MEDVMDATMDYNPSNQHFSQAMHERYDAHIVNNPSNTTVLTEMDRLYEQMRSVVATAAQPREPIRDIPVKVHVRKPDKDSWAYMGRGVVSQEITGQSSRVVVRSATSHKILTVFGESRITDVSRAHLSDLVVGACTPNACTAYASVNLPLHINHHAQALNHSETVRLLASIELAAYACKQAMADPALHSAIRRRIARVIKDDRRRRHKRRKDQDAMISAFARTGLAESEAASASNATTTTATTTNGANAVPSAYAPSFPTPASGPPPTEPVPVPAPIPMPIPNPASASSPRQTAGGLFAGMQPEL
ncbi:hypothetical protein BN946_scf184911.g125 [Trametes cinnabarina]|uniref:Uncharacterized protein n=1 Tax=Pycnoporus cinnabarinus TaxID=5643 RepID=A0A060SHD1_PYCCI|nr:hypothetical protein BN946_scf184911.g125 [Trametes cinnabarina]